MTKKIAVSLPDDVAEWLAGMDNVSAYVAESVRIRMEAQETREILRSVGFEFTEEGRAKAAAQIAEARAKITPELIEFAAKLRANPRPEPQS
jgi:hypothetical protein